MLNEQELNKLIKYIEKQFKEREKKPKIHMLGIHQLSISPTTLRGRFEVVNLIEDIINVGMLRPIVITREHQIVDGIRRYVAAIQLGMQHVPCVYDESSPNHLSPVPLMVGEIKNDNKN